MYKILYLPTAQFVEINPMGESLVEVKSYLNSNYIRFYNSANTKEVSWAQYAPNSGKMPGEIPKHLFEIVEVINVSNS